MGQLELSRSAYASGSDAVKIGLIGCGGRGTGAAVNALNTGPGITLVALADVFRDKLDSAREKLKARKGAQVAVKDDHLFAGFDAYRQLIDSGVDAVLIAPASHFIPTHLQAAIAAGKHVFCEKPHGIDIPGVNRCLAACEEARRKSLAVVSGLCWRYDPGLREGIRRVRDGAIGETAERVNVMVPSMKWTGAGL